MFKNIGEKIKTLAIACTIIGCILSLAGAIYCWATGIVFLGFIILILGCLFSWVGSFVLYGFGELITQTTNIAKGNQRMQMLSIYKNSEESNNIAKETIEEIQSEVIEDYEYEKHGYIDELDKINKPKKDECPSCFNKISSEDKECPYCGYKLK